MKTEIVFVWTPQGILISWDTGARSTLTSEHWVSLVCHSAKTQWELDVDLGTLPDDRIDTCSNKYEFW